MTTAFWSTVRSWWSGAGTELVLRHASNDGLKEPRTELAASPAAYSARGSSGISSLKSLVTKHEDNRLHSRQSVLKVFHCSPSLRVGPNGRNEFALMGNA
jgi:hypothetical protein